MVTNFIVCFTFILWEKIDKYLKVSVVINDLFRTFYKRRIFSSANFSKMEDEEGIDLIEERDDHSRTIIHIDIDCFYAQVEMVKDPSLVDKPLGIQQKNIVVTCNYVARQRGVTKCQYISDALKVCPDLVLVNGEDLAHYRKVMQRFIINFKYQFQGYAYGLG